MATLARLQARSTALAHQYYFRNSVVDVFRKKENDAAVKIQSWFRGCRVRAYIRYLHRIATTVQKWWRGYLGRQHCQLIVEIAYCAMKMNIYNAMAVRIQRWWRGYRIRKYCFDYIYLKAYLRAVSRTNDTVMQLRHCEEKLKMQHANFQEQLKRRTCLHDSLPSSIRKVQPDPERERRRSWRELGKVEALDEFAEIKEREEKEAALKREKKKKDYQARKMHYLLSTKQIPGIYNSPFREEPDPWELRLQQAKPLMRKRQRGRLQCPPSLTSWLACTSARSFPRSETLPPIDRKQCQGPFRDIADVLDQRYRPLEPTLRVAEPINGLKEAREEFRRQEEAKNIQDNVFLPFTSYHKKEKYIPSLHLSSKGGSSSYGCQRFRDENPKKWICGKDFQTVLPSFDLFSTYGKSYSKAGQIL